MLQFGPEIELVPSLKNRSHFLSAGLAGEDKASEYDDPKFYTLQSLMEMNSAPFFSHLIRSNPISKFALDVQTTPLSIS